MGQKDPKLTTWFMVTPLCLVVFMLSVAVVSRYTSFRRFWAFRVPIKRAFYLAGITIRQSRISKTKRKGAFSRIKKYSRSQGANTRVSLHH